MKVLQINIIKGIALQCSILILKSHINRLEYPQLYQGLIFHYPPQERKTDNKSKSKKDINEEIKPERKKRERERETETERAREKALQK